MTTFKQSSSKVMTETSQAMLEPDLIIQQGSGKSWERFIISLLHQKDHLVLWAFLKRTLKQFKLDSMYSETDVIDKTDKITQEKIESGETIDNPPGWFRKTAFNVIRNLSKKETNQRKNIKKLHNNIETAYYPESLINEDYSEEQVEALCRNWNGLSEQERRILILREVKELSWKQVANQLVIENHEIDNSRLVDRVRQKGNRALAKLRKLVKKSL